MPAAIWIKGKKRIKGVWSYSWNKDAFIINIFKRCPISGQAIEFRIHGDTPEFNGWKLEKKDANVNTEKGISV